MTIVDPDPAGVAARMSRDFSVPEDHVNAIADYFSKDFDLEAALYSS